MENQRQILTLQKFSHLCEMNAHHITVYKLQSSQSAARSEVHSSLSFFPPAYFLCEIQSTKSVVEQFTLFIRFRDCGIFVGKACVMVTIKNQFLRIWTRERVFLPNIVYPKYCLTYTLNEEEETDPLYALHCLGQTPGPPVCLTRISI